MILADRKYVTGYSSEKTCLKHDTGHGHPESSQRLIAIERKLKETGIYEKLKFIPAAQKIEQQVLDIHDQNYIETVRKNIEANEDSLSTGDTAINEFSLEAAYAAAGCAIASVDAVMTGSVRNAFCAIRPPGHHATRSKGMGFCIFNNAAIAARHIQKQYGLERIMIVDWDVHHGNGTQEIFYDDPSVFFFSAHQFPAYPGTGTITETGSGAGKGFTMNCPLARGSGDREIIAAFQNKLVPAAANFKPEFVIISAGFDARKGDPIGGLNVTDNGFEELTKIVMRIAEKYADGRILSCLEGGYNLDGLASSVERHIMALRSYQPNID